MQLLFGLKEGQFLQEWENLELWQLPFNRIKEAVISAYEVYKEIIASKNHFPFKESIIEDAIELYENWAPYSVLLAYQTKNKDIIATTCLTQKKPGICFLVEDEFRKYALENNLPQKEHNFYFGSMTSVNKSILHQLNYKKGISFNLYKQMNLFAAQRVAQDENNVYLGEFEKTAFLTINKSLSMGWKQIGKDTAWLGSSSVPAYLPAERLLDWLKNK